MVSPLRWHCYDTMQYYHMNKQPWKEGEATLSCLKRKRCVEEFSMDEQHLCLQHVMDSVSTAPSRARAPQHVAREILQILYTIRIVRHVCPSHGNCDMAMHA